MSATSHNAPQTKSCAVVLGASSKDLHVSEKLWMNNACEGVGFRSRRRAAAAVGAVGGLRSPEQINPSRAVIVARLREQTLTLRLDPVMLVGRHPLARRDASHRARNSSRLLSGPGSFHCQPSNLCRFRPGVCKLWPGGHMRPARIFNPACQTSRNYTDRK